VLFLHKWLITSFRILLKQKLKQGIFTKKHAINEVQAELKNVGYFHAGFAHFIATSSANPQYRVISCGVAEGTISENLVLYCL